MCSFRTPIYSLQRVGLTKLGLCAIIKSTTTYWGDPMYYIAEIADEHILRTVRAVMDMCGATESSSRAKVAFCDEVSASRYIGKSRCVVLYRDAKFLQSTEYSTLSTLGEFVALKMPFPIDELVRLAFDGGVIHSAAEIPSDKQPADEGFAHPYVICEGRFVTVGENTVELTAKEFGLFEYLYQRAGKIVGREELLREVWKRETESNIVDVYASYLRRKLDLILPPGSLSAVRGLGYVLKI